MAHFAVELRTARLEINMSDSLVLDMPVELGLELMTIVGPYLLDSEGEFFDDVINKVDGAGLASKNAVLIVEFARALEQQGKDVVEAALEAAKMRLRPILMTSLAFGFGVMPLALATGAGARVAIGTAVVGGMIAATVFGVFFAPLFYVIVRKVTGTKTTAPQTQMVEAQS